MMTRSNAGRSRGFSVLMAGVLVAALGGAFCPAAEQGGKAGKSGKGQGTDADVVVATFKGGRITLGEIQTLLEKQRSRYLLRRLKTPEGRISYVRNLVQNRVLAEEARRRGIDKDPDVRARIDGLLAGELLQRLRKARRNIEISDEEARKYYEQHKAEFERPERKRVSRILLRAKTPAEIEAKTKVANELLQQLQKAGNRRIQLFHTLVQKYSDDAYGKRRGGYFALISANMKPNLRITKEILDAVSALEKPGDVSGIVRTPEGVQIFMLEGKIPAFKQTFERALPLIKARLRARRLADTRSLAADIFEKADIQINEAALEKLRVPEPPSYPGRRGRIIPVKPKPGKTNKVRRTLPQPPPAPGKVVPKAAKPAPAGQATGEKQPRKEK